MSSDVLRGSAIRRIRHERQRQIEKWGEQHHHPLLWNAILNEEIGEVSKGILDWMNAEGTEKDNLARELDNELIQSAAVIVAWLESRWDEQEGSFDNGNFG